MKLYSSNRKPYPGKPENQLPLYSSNQFSGPRTALFLLFSAAALLLAYGTARGLLALLRATGFQLSEPAVLLGLLLASASLMAVLFFIAFVREAACLFRDRRSFVEVYPDRIVGLGRNVKGPGPRYQYICCSPGEVLARCYHPSDLVFYSKDNTLVCYAGKYGKKIESLLFDEYEKRLPKQ